jgi:inosine/xanthosine triphosphatase
MKLIVGSKNQKKVEAVKDALNEYPQFATTEVGFLDVSSGVSEQPTSLEETIEGAKNRAKNAFKHCDYGLGLESGIFPVPHTKSGYMDITICAIYDGKNYHIGGSSIFEYPKALVDMVFDKGYDVSTAAKEAGFTDQPKLGEAEGMIGILTKGYLDRKEYSKQAVITALIHLLNPEHY